MQGAESKTRRSLMRAGAATATLALTGRARAQDAFLFEEQQGDPSLQAETLRWANTQVRKLRDDPPEILGAALAEFSVKFRTAAEEFVGMNRSANETEITEMLETLGMSFRSGEPLRPTPFCAAGVTYVAALAYARANAEDLTTDKLRKLRNYLPHVWWHHFPTTFSVADMQNGAEATRRWRVLREEEPPDHIYVRSVDVQPGWLIVFDFNAPGAFNHVGIVDRFDEATQRFHTIEFNTCREDATGGSQGNGGHVARRTRPTSAVSGFIDTLTRSPF